MYSPLFAPLSVLSSLCFNLCTCRTPLSPFPFLYSRFRKYFAFMLLCAPSVCLFLCPSFPPCALLYCSISVPPPSQIRLMCSICMLCDLS
jgi:hypothetical protein